VLVAALYDVHGNLPALEAVLAEVEREHVDLVVFGGDIAAGPFPGQTLELVAALGERALAVRGNADRELVSAHGRPEQDAGDVWVRRAGWAAARLTEAQLAFLGSLPQTATLDIGGERVLFCHGTPRSDEEIVTSASPDPRVARILAEVEADVVVCGHTHVQFDRDVHGVRLVNAGSVGMPYEGEPGAFWALLGRGIELRRTAYDVVAAAGRLRASGYPEPDELVADLYDRPVPAAEATAHFEALVAGR
jgi:putative phosphoesterase